MAVRGQKPKPTRLKLVTGNPGKRPINAAEPKPAGKPVKPAFVKGKAAKLWAEYSRIGFWLTEADSHALAVWCALGAEIEKDVARMNSSRISQWRTLSSELGFLPASRSRLHGGKEEDDSKDKDQRSQYYA
jgi:phage terminase small subunit